MEEIGKIFRAPKRPMGAGRKARGARWDKRKIGVRTKKFIREADVLGAERRLESSLNKISFPQLSRGGTTEQDFL
ncbi:MAG: hypothetical protein QW356_07265 [Candidatus Hadarchaeales archaeon]